MRYWCYAEQNELGEDIVVTVSEDDIIRSYWPYWREQGIKKFGKEEFEKTFCEEDCISDFLVVHWAWESK